MKDEDPGILYPYINVTPTFSSLENNSRKFIPWHPSRSPVLPSPPLLFADGIFPSIRDSVRAYTVQCANCSKWRFVPTKQKYGQIRETIAELPFCCETAREWRPEITCDDESDLVKDGSWRWAIDKPSIPQPPHGWQRILRIRAEGGLRFSDVYYIAPSGERFRSMVKVQGFLNEHPEYQGVTESQFSFLNPAPMEENYVRKRCATSAASHKMSGSLVQVPMEENYERKRRATCTASPAMSGALVPAATPISWVAPDQLTDLHFGEEGNSTSEVEAEAPAESLGLGVNDPSAGNGC